MPQIEYKTTLPGDTPVSSANPLPVSITGAASLGVETDQETVSPMRFLTIQPSGTEQWQITRIYFERPVEISFYDGTYYVPVRQDSINSQEDGPWLVTNSRYLKVRNLDLNESSRIGYDGWRIV